MHFPIFSFHKFDGNYDDYFYRAAQILGHYVMGLLSVSFFSSVCRHNGLCMLNIVLVGQILFNFKFKDP